MLHDGTTCHAHGDLRARLLASRHRGAGGEGGGVVRRRASRAQAGRARALLCAPRVRVFACALRLRRRRVGLSCAALCQPTRQAASDVP